MSKGVARLDPAHQRKPKPGHPWGKYNPEWIRNHNRRVKPTPTTKTPK